MRQRLALWCIFFVVSNKDCKTMHNKIMLNSK